MPGPGPGFAAGTFRAVRAAARWVTGPSATAMYDQWNGDEVARVAVLTFSCHSALDALAVLLANLGSLPVDPHTAHTLANVGTVGVAALGLYRRYKQGVRVRVDAPHQEGVVLLTPPPDRTTVIVTPGGAPPLEIPPVAPAPYRP